MLEDENDPIDIPADESRDVNSTGDHGEGEEVSQQAGRRAGDWPRMVAFVVVPCLALALAVGVGYLKWQDASARSRQAARIESVAAAKDSTIALLSYQPDTVEKDLEAARTRLTGSFRDSYTSLTHNVVIPGAKQKHISAVATVPAASSVSATPNHAVVLVFVDQKTVIGGDEPTDTASSVRVTLDKVGDRWLISSFDPV
jgi:Mce-associated membrane protein